MSNDLNSERPPPGARRRWALWWNAARAMPQPALFGRDIEGVLALGRGLLAVLFLVVLLFGEKPGRPAMILATVGYFTISMLGVSCAAMLRRQWPARVLLGLDVAYGAALLLLGGPLGHFMMVYTFSILASAAQWGWRGGGLIGGALLAAYVFAYVGHVIPHELLLTRVLYFSVAGALVARAAYDGELARGRLHQLARWASGRFDPSDDAVCAVLRHAADVLEAQGVVVLWRQLDDDTPRQLLYWSQRDDARRDALSEPGLHDELPETVRSKPFVLIDRRRQVCLTYEGPQTCAGAVPAAVLALPAAGAVVASDCFSGRYCEGRLFAFGIAAWRWEQLILVELVAKQVLARLEGRMIRTREAEAVAERERARMARDLHDGILQSLTAARLLLQVADASPAEDAAAARQNASALLRDEQRKLRRFIEEQRGDEPSASEPLDVLAATIRSAAAQWRIKADVKITSPEARVPAAMARELAFLLHEAVANAAKHGAAGVFSAEVSVDDEVVNLRLANPTSADRSRFAAAPRSLSDRVLAFGGTLTVEVDAHLIIFVIRAPLP